MNKRLGMLVSEKPIVRSLSFHKYSVKVPRDWNYGMIAMRLFLVSMDLLDKGILSTYLVKEEEGLQAWLLVYGSIKEEKLSEVLAKRALALGRYEGECELNPQENVKEFKNLLDVWVKYKLSKVFKYDYDLDAWLVKWIERDKKERALCFTTQVEYTPKGYLVLWVDPSIRIRYSLADYINDKLEEMGIKYTIQEIGKDKKLREDPVIVRALEQILEIITGEFAIGEGKSVNLIIFTKEGDKVVTKGRVESVIPSWTDQHPLKPSRQDLLSRKKQQLITDFLEEAERMTLYEYITKRRMKKKRKYHPEYPVIKARTKRRSLDFTPSDILIQYREKRLTMSPKKRYNYFEKIVKKIMSSILVDFSFLSEPVKLVHKLPSEFKLKRSRWKNWRLGVKDNSGIRPLPMLREGGKPLGGPLQIHLVYVVPDLGRKEVESLISDRNELIKRKFTEHNLGEIVGYSIKFYEWIEQNVERTRENIRRTLIKALKETSNLPEGVITFPVVVGPNYKGRYYEDVKREASRLGKHSQIILWNNFVDMNDETAATLACDIYVETLIQENIHRLEELDGLVWRLANPADGKGETIYIGFDYSRDREDRVSGAFAMLCDSYGRLISVRHTSLISDYITEEAARDIFVYALEKACKYAEKKSLKKPKRIVLYRDGPLRPLERTNIVRGFKRSLKALELNEKVMCLDLVEIIKRHSKRMYSRYKGEITNPWFGEYVVMPALSNFHDGRALVSSTFVDFKKIKEGELDYTVKPIEIRFTSYSSRKSNIEKIVDEYLALTALNFWSPLRRSKLCLPLILAHNLANLTRIGVQPRLPE